MRAKLWKVADSSFCCNREQERGIVMYLHRYMHASILVPPITHTEAWWPRSRIAQFKMGWMHMKTQRDLTPSWMIRSVGDWGIEIHSIHTQGLGMVYVQHEVIHIRAYIMQWMKWDTLWNNGLTPTRVDLSHAHIRGQQMKMRLSECVHTCTQTEDRP